VSGGEWGMEREVLTQHSAGSGEWKWHEIVKSVRFQRFQRVVPILYEFDRVLMIFKFLIQFNMFLSFDS